MYTQAIALAARREPTGKCYYPHMRGSCSICAAPAEVLTAINYALARHEKLRDIEKRSGFSKSSLHRHSNKCIPRNAIVSYKTVKLNSVGRRYVVQWPDGSLTTSTVFDSRGHAVEQRADQPLQRLTFDQINPETDIVLVVEYEKAIVKNPDDQAHT